MILLLSVFLPVIAGVLLLLLPENKIQKVSDYGFLCRYTGAFLVVSMLLSIYSVFSFSGKSIDVVSFNEYLTIAFAPDALGKFFAIVMSVVWVAVGFFSFEYMKHEDNKKRFFGVYIMVLGILMGLCFSGNLITYYAFYELMTLGSFAMVLHSQTREAIMAGLKYLFYSFAGAYMVLFGIYFVSKYSIDSGMTFREGGILNMSLCKATGVIGFSGTCVGGGVLSVAMLLMILGFSVKAGMFPMHGWLPTAHPVAPAPASGVLSAIIVKSGVLGIIRVIYYIFGVQLFSGSYVQKTVLILSLTTVFVGSMLAYKEKVLKKRMAYSTVSQVSYILFGVFMANDTAFDGALIHVAAHAAIKSTLFLCAGAIIYLTGCTKVTQLKGIGKKMPVLLWCYTVASLGLIGIPPFGGFASKWYLCVGALDANIPVFSWLGPVILLISALLTAGYLLPISIDGFLPGKGFEENANSAALDDEKYMGYKKASEPGLIMLVPIIILTAASVIIGVFPGVISWG